MAWSNYLQNVLTSQPEYLKRVHASFYKVAVDVTQEEDTVPNHAERLVLAEKVLNGSGVPSRAHLMLHLLNPALQATPEPSDADLEFTVNDQWNYFAGIN